MYRHSCPSNCWNGEASLAIFMASSYSCRPDDWVKSYPHGKWMIWYSMHAWICPEHAWFTASCLVFWSLDHSSQITSIKCESSKLWYPSKICIYCIHVWFIHKNKHLRETHNLQPVSSSPSPCNNGTISPLPTCSWDGHYKIIGHFRCNESTSSFCQRKSMIQVLVVSL